MKLFAIASLFTAVLSVLAAPAATSSTKNVATQLDDDAAQPALNECASAGGVCRKSACHSGEVSVPLECGHDQGCCLGQ